MRTNQRRCVLPAAGPICRGVKDGGLIWVVADPRPCVCVEEVWMHKVWDPHLWVVADPEHRHKWPQRLLLLCEAGQLGAR